MAYDLVVIGGGAAGLAAARTGRRRGATVALVTDGPVGGECTFVGCVPSKTLIEAAGQGCRFHAAMARVRATVERVAATETAQVLRAEGIDVLEGQARLAGPRQVDVDGRPVSYRGLVIAAGAGPALPPIPGITQSEVLTNENVFDLTDPPASLLVVGGGPIGVELAQAFARLGVTVTIVEAASRLLPREEPEASAVVNRALTTDGIAVATGRQITVLHPHDHVGVSAGLDDGSSVTATRVLVAVGRRPATVDLGLDDAGVATGERGWILTDTRMRTNIAGIYAAGDVTGRFAFTHAADEMGRIAATNALARLPLRSFDERSIPAVTFTDPEIARVGLTEHGAATTIRGARVAYLPLDELDRAITAGRTDGYIKLIAAPRRPTGTLAGGRLIGATIVAARAGEMIALPTLAMRTRMYPARLALTVQAYPTWTVGIRQAAAQLFLETGGRTARPAKPTPLER